MALIELALAAKASSSSSLQQAFTIFKYKQLIEEHLAKKFKSSKASVAPAETKQAADALPQVNGGLDAQQIQAYA